MKEFLLVILLFLDKIYSLSVPTDSNAYCNKNTCPKYKVVQKFKDLELRCYEPSIWVSISAYRKLFVEDHHLPVWKLQQFINGNNTKGIDVPIGVLTSKLFDESKRIVTAEYYVPSYFWKFMPREVDRSVRVLYRQAFCVYVYGFPGWIHGYEILSYYRTLTKRLIKQQANSNDFYPDFFFYMSYHSGFPFIPDFNEIWYVIKFENDRRRKSGN